MDYEEKLIRYVASKIIQKQYFYVKGEFPDDNKLKSYINRVLKKLQDKYGLLRNVRIHSKKGLITPQIYEAVCDLKIK